MESVWKAIAEVVPKIQNSPDVTYRRLGGHCTERGNLGHGILAITVFDVLDNLVAAMLAKVHVEVRHGNTFRIQESFENQVVRQRIKVGDQQ